MSEWEERDALVQRCVDQCTDEKTGQWRPKDAQARLAHVLAAERGVTTARTAPAAREWYRHWEATHALELDPDEEYYDEDDPEFWDTDPYASEVYTPDAAANAALDYWDRHPEVMNLREASRGMQVEWLGETVE